MSDNNILIKYQGVFEDFANHLKSLFGPEIALFCLTGSLSRSQIIPGWSDIDVLVVFTEIKIDTFVRLRELFKSNETDIKIGITFYSLKEFNTYSFQDPKTFNTIRKIESGELTPLVLADDVIIKKVGSDFLSFVNGVEFTKDLHALKRHLLLYPDFDEQRVFKHITYMFRALLIQDGIYVDGYQEVWAEIGQRYGDDLGFALMSPLEVIENKVSLEERYRNYLNILSWFGDRKLRLE